MTFSNAGPEALVGRAAGLVLIRAFLGRGGRDGEALWLVDDLGVGRTALLDTAAGAALTAGNEVLGASVVEFEADLPLRVAPGPPPALRSVHAAQQDTL
jgi:hypothetical protein